MPVQSAMPAAVPSAGNAAACPGPGEAEEAARWETFTQVLALNAVWFQLAALMGHADPATTRDIYLGPFCGLQVDYLMSLLDEEEKTGVEALVRAVAADSGRALTGIAAPAAGNISPAGEGGL